MAARDILTLKTPMAEGIIRLLYIIALIFIALGVLMGLARGVRIMTQMPMMARPAITSTTNPPADATAPQASQSDAQNARPGPRFGYGGGRFDRDRFGMMGHRRFGMMGPGRYGMMGGSPAIFGLFMIVRALLGGFIALLIVRVLAELGLAILAMPRRAAA